MVIVVIARAFAARATMERERVVNIVVEKKRSFKKGTVWILKNNTFCTSKTER